MFDVVETFLVKLVDMMPAILGIYLLFDFTGALLFSKR